MEDSGVTGQGVGWGVGCVGAAAVHGAKQLCTASVLSQPLVRSWEAQGRLLGEAVCSSEDPCWCDEAAPTEVDSVALNADLPGPFTF